MDLKDIYTILPSLSKDQLKELKGRINIYLNSNHTKETIQITTDSYIKNVICLYAKRYVGVLGPEVLAKNPFQLNTRLNALAIEIETWAKELKLDRRHTIKLCHVLIQAAIAKLEDSKRDVSFKMIIFYMSDPKSLIEESFPGYMKLKRFRGIILQ